MTTPQSLDISPNMQNHQPNFPFALSQQPTLNMNARLESTYGPYVGHQSSANAFDGQDGNRYSSMSQQVQQIQGTEPWHCYPLNHDANTTSSVYLAHYWPEGPSYNFGSPHDDRNSYFLHVAQHPYEHHFSQFNFAGYFEPLQACHKPRKFPSKAQRAVLGFGPSAGERPLTEPNRRGRKRNPPTRDRIGDPVDLPQCAGLVYFPNLHSTNPLRYGLFNWPDDPGDLLVDTRTLNLLIPSPVCSARPYGDDAETPHITTYADTAPPASSSITLTPPCGWSLDLPSEVIRVLEAIGNNFSANGGRVVPLRTRIYHQLERVGLHGHFGPRGDLLGRSSLREYSLSQLGMSLALWNYLDYKYQGRRGARMVYDGDSVTDESLTELLPEAGAMMVFNGRKIVIEAGDDVEGRTIVGEDLSMTEEQEALEAEMIRARIEEREARLRMGYRQRWFE